MYKSSVYISDEISQLISDLASIRSQCDDEKLRHKASDVLSKSDGGKYKSNKESILRNWKTLKQSIEPVHLVQKLERCNFLPKSSFEKFGNKSRSHQATLVLIKVYRQVQSSEKKYDKFVEILRRHNRFAADALTNPVGIPINKPETVDKHLIEQLRDHLKKNEKKIKDKLKRYPEVLLKITDDFIECDILDIDTVEKILYDDSLKEVPQRLVELVIANIHLGAYNRLLETLKSEKNLKGLVFQLTTAGVGEAIKTGKPNLHLASSEFPHVSTETDSGILLTLSTTPKIPNMDSSLLAQHSPADLAVFKVFGSVIVTKNKGSAIFRFATNVSAAKDKIQEGAITSMIEDIITHTDDSNVKKIVQLKVTLRRLHNKKSNMSTAILSSATLLSGVPTLQNIARTQLEQQTTESVQHSMNETIIAANRSYLIEEINTMALAKAFKNKGITCFYGLDGTLGRQQMAEDFLTILERNNLLDQQLDILREQGMTYVLDRLNNCRNAYSADPQILRPNISNNRIDILENLDIDDVREIFIEREVFSSSMFDEIEKKYSGSEDQMCIVLIEIINSGPRAMRTLVDVLYINQLDSLAASILWGTRNELQEMQDNTQIGTK